MFANILKIWITYQNKHKKMLISVVVCEETITFMSLSSLYQSIAPEISVSFLENVDVCKIAVKHVSSYYVVK